MVPCWCYLATMAASFHNVLLPLPKSKTEFTRLEGADHGSKSFIYQYDNRFATGPTQALLEYVNCLYSTCIHHVQNLLLVSLLLLFSHSVSLWISFQLPFSLETLHRHQHDNQPFAGCHCQCINSSSPWRFCLVLQTFWMFETFGTTSWQ